MARGSGLLWSLRRQFSVHKTTMLGRGDYLGNWDSQGGANQIQR